MKNIIVYILLFITLNIYCQNKNIKLPQGYGFEVEYSNTSITPIFRIYMDKNEELSFEGINLQIEQLNDSIAKYLFQFPDKILNTKAHIFANKRISYQEIEALKYEITKGSLFRIVFITNNYDESIKGIPLRLHRTSIKKRKVVQDKEQDEILVDIPLSIDIGEEIIENLYDLNFKKVQKLLKNCSYSNVKIYHKNKIIIDGKKISLKNEKDISKALKAKDFLFLQTNKKISYNTYLKSLSILKRNFKKDKALFSFIEVSSELQEILKNRKIKL